MEDFNNVNFYDGTVEYNSTDNIELSNVNDDRDTDSQEIFVNTGDSVDYSGYFNDIVENLDSINTMMTVNSDSSETETDVVTLDDIHHDLQLLMIVFLCFFAVFVGHGFVNKFRNL